MKLPAPVTEAGALAELKAMAQQNKILKSFIGQGYYGGTPHTRRDFAQHFGKPRLVYRLHTLPSRNQHKVAWKLWSISKP